MRATFAAPFLAITLAILGMSMPVHAGSCVQCEPFLTVKKVGTDRAELFLGLLDDYITGGGGHTVKSGPNAIDGGFTATVHYPRMCRPVQNTFDRDFSLPSAFSANFTDATLHMKATCGKSVDCKKGTRCPAGGI